MKEKGLQPATRRFAGNFASILTSDVLTRGTTFLIYLMVARELGTQAFGQMSLALTFFYSFQVMAVFGMSTLLTREVAKHSDQSSRYFTCGSLLAVVTALASMAMLAAMVKLIDYSPETSRLILLTSLALVPFALGAVCEAVIRGWEQMHLIALAKVPVNVLTIAGTMGVLWNGGSIHQVIIVIVISHFAVFLLLLGTVLWKMKDWHTDLLDTSFLIAIIKRSSTFVGIDTVIAWLASVNIVLISKLLGETDTGLYNAASQLLIPLMIFFQSVMISAFPIMCRKYESGRDGLQRVANKLIGLLLAMAIPGAIGLMMLAEPALEFVYAQPEFKLAASVLRITALTMILSAGTFALGNVLLAGSQERTTFRIVVVNLIVAVAAGWVLINQFGLIGAAVAALLTRFVDLIQHIGPARQIIRRIDLGVAWKPLVASGVMAAFLLLVRDHHLVLAIASGALVYFASLALMEAWTVGGFRNLYARYF